MHMNRLVVALVALPIALTACDSGPKPVTDPNAVAKAEQRAAVDAKNLMGVEWRCVSVQSDGMLGGPPLTLTFGDDGRVTGFGGVNRFSGPYRSATGSVQVGPLVATKMGGEPARMALEQKLLDSLARVNAFSLQGGLLRLKEGDRVLVEYSR